MSRNDVVVLARASAARVVDTIPAKERFVPGLSDPRLAVERAHEAVARIRPAISDSLESS